MTARLPVPQAASSSFAPGRSSIRDMNCSAAEVMNFATSPKSPLSQVAFWRALMVWISLVDCGINVFMRESSRLLEACKWNESPRGLSYNEPRLQRDGIAQVGIVWGRGHYGAVDFLELFRCAVAPEVNRVAELFVTCLYGRINAQETAKVDVAVGLDAQFLELDTFVRAEGAIPHNHAGVERGEKVFLRVGILIRAAQLQRLVHFDGEVPGNLFAPNYVTGYTRVGAGSAAPVRGDLPIRLALGGVFGDRVNGAAQGFGVDAV